MNIEKQLETAIKTNHWLTRNFLGVTICSFL